MPMTALQGHQALAQRTLGGARPFQKASKPLHRAPSATQSSRRPALVPGQRRCNGHNRRVLVVAHGLFDRGDQQGDMTVAITGATGLVGSRLVAKLTSQGHTVKALTRDTGRAQNKLPYSNVEVVGPDSWESAMAGCYGVVNLAGEPIATRWDERIKREIKDSRVNTTRRIAQGINGLPNNERPKVLVSASAVGFYGVSPTETFDENSDAGADYLAEVCREWEAAAQEALGRVVIIRTGIVLSTEGGALAKMVPVFNMFGGGPVGSGEQWMSWVHLDDLVDLYIMALRKSSFTGVYNGTAPSPVRMGELCQTLGSAMGRPSWLPVPDFALKGLLGEGATVVLNGQKVLPARTRQEGFDFKFSDVQGAIDNLVRKQGGVA